MITRAGLKLASGTLYVIHDGRPLASDEIVLPACSQLSERTLLAAEFVLIFKYVADLIGKACALFDARVQAARARYRAVCA